MTVVEAWRGRAAQLVHTTTDHMKRYRDGLLPMSGSLYDERIYRAIGETGPRRPRRSRNR
jgi:quinol monooxygenase YgiN